MIPFFEDLKTYILSLIGNANDTGGSATAGSVRGKQNRIIADIASLNSMSTLKRILSAPVNMTTSAGPEMDIPDDALIVSAKVLGAPINNSYIYYSHTSSSFIPLWSCDVNNTQIVNRLPISGRGQKIQARYAGSGTIQNAVIEVYYY